MSSIYDEYFAIRKMYFKTYVGKTLKYCISWKPYDETKWSNPSDLAMVTKGSLRGYTDEELSKIKMWREYKREIDYKSSFENYAIEKKINLTCTYGLTEVFAPIVCGIPRVEEEQMPELIEVPREREEEVYNVEEMQVEEVKEIPRVNDFVNVVNYAIMCVILILHILAVLSHLV